MFCKFVRMKLKQLFGLIIITQLLCGCSWVEKFVLINESNESVNVIYSIGLVEKGFAVFTHQPQAYQLTKGKKIDWNETLQVEDSDTSLLSVAIKLPPKSAIVFGALHNDQYVSSTQNFINGRHFNFIKMQISSSKQKEIITTKNFDEKFQKKNTVISYTFN